ncbi:MAG: GNAT family N-acetyltransferase [Burkholderiaceae bacterium]|nr:GNAT family N-acetyltransferase [Microbacteriaceae bacterium]
MTAIIRPAIPHDASRLHEVAAATFPLACPPGFSEADAADFVAEHLSEKRMLDYLADPDRALLVAEAGGAIVGYVMLVLGDPQDSEVLAAITVRPTSELSKCYLLPGHHGTGTASAMVDAVVAVAREHGASAVWLGVNQLNAKANRFYEKSGFALVGTKHFLVGGRLEDDFVRELVL